MKDIIYIGNISNDTIICNENKYESLGGSSIYSSFASKSVNPNLKIGIIGNADEKTIKKIRNNQIDFLGNEVENMTQFSINENNQECVGKNYTEVKYNGKKEKTEHLHVSFRKGINIDSIFSKCQIEYNTLSVDVIKYSLNYILPFLRKYSSKIDILFCNLEEYNIIKENILDIKTICITNESNPAIVLDQKENYMEYIKKVNNIKSTTGAGDSFIGGFLAEYIKNHDLVNSLRNGVGIARKSISMIGPTKKTYKIQNNTRIYKIPQTVIVIGNSCTGKTTFIKYFISNFGIYDIIDDLNPLLEVFKIDDELKEKNNYLKKVKYAKDIIEEYKKSNQNICFYSQKAKNGKGHDIIRPELWDKILLYSVKGYKGKNVIIQFARGNDKLYKEKLNRNPYDYGLKNVIENTENKENCIIINLRARLEERLIRNEKRKNDGGHFVSEDTMKKIYKEDIFRYETQDNFKIKNISNARLPVFVIYNHNINIEDQRNFYNKRIKNIIDKYNDFKEKNYGTK